MLMKLMSSIISERKQVSSHISLKSEDQLAIEAGSERLRELNGVRSQIDFKLFIMKLLKEEHR